MRADLLQEYLRKVCFFGKNGFRDLCIEKCAKIRENAEKSSPLPLKVAMKSQVGYNEN